MCEFKVYLGGKQVAEDVIFAKQENGKAILKDIIGKSLTFDGVEITEVNVLSTRLVLSHKSSGD